MSISRLLSQASDDLAGLPGGRLEAEVLLGHVLGVTRAWLYANSDQPVDPAQSAAFLQAIERRVEGVPLAYLTGTREFWSLSLKINEAVLIPRPETELLVETALTFIPENVAWRIADLGTGSGAIALALASERPNCEIHATDISADALFVARDNAERLGLSGVQFHLGSWFDALSGRFHLILSNPPYVPGGDTHLQRGDCRFEPAGALTPGADGLAAIRTIASGARDYLEKDGVLAFEHGYDQAENCRTLLAQSGFQDVRSIRDLANIERVTLGICR